MRARVLVTGWSSFLHGEATAGDVASMHTADAWLTAAGVAHDLAWSPVLAAAWGGVDLEVVDPHDYTHLLFVCGPLGGWQVDELCDRFAACRRVAVGVSVVEGGSAERFHVVVPRDAPDGSATVDLSVAAPRPAPWPLVVRIDANPQPEYGGRARHREVHAVIDEALASAEVAVVAADTRLDPRVAGQRSGAALDGILAAAAAVVTTRLHGLVLALRSGTPVVAVDPVAGGAKVTAQAGSLGWPAVLGATTSPPDVEAQLRWCLGPAAAAAVTASQAVAAGSIGAVRTAAGSALELF